MHDILLMTVVTRFRRRERLRDNWWLRSDRRRSCHLIRACAVAGVPQAIRLVGRTTFMLSRQDISSACCPHGRRTGAPGGSGCFRDYGTGYDGMRAWATHRNILALYWSSDDPREGAP